MVVVREEEIVGQTEELNVLLRWPLKSCRLKCELVYKNSNIVINFLTYKKTQTKQNKTGKKVSPRKTLWNNNKTFSHLQSNVNLQTSWVCYASLQIFSLVWHVYGLMNPRVQRHQKFASGHPYKMNGTTVGIISLPVTVVSHFNHSRKTNISCSRILGPRSQTADDLSENQGINTDTGRRKNHLEGQIQVYLQNTGRKIVNFSFCFKSLMIK